MTPSQEGLPTKAKEAPFPHEVRLALLDTKLVFQCLGEKVPRPIHWSRTPMDDFEWMSRIF